MATASDELCRLIRRNDLRSIQALFEARGSDAAQLLQRDQRGYTPLMHAVGSATTGVDIVGVLLEYEDHRYAAQTRSYESDAAIVLKLALGRGDMPKIRLLMAHGMDLHYVDASGYGAILNAVHRRDVLHDPELLTLLRFLVAEKVELNGISKYQESGLRVLSRIGRFDAVALLLEAGADPDHLKWTPLMRAVTLGSLEDVRNLIDGGAELEGTDYWERTAFLLAIQTGDISKAQLLRVSGANPQARGRCRKPPLSYAIDNYHIEMLRWLLEVGASITDQDEFGHTPLMTAARCDNVEALELLLEAKADVLQLKSGQSALSEAQTAQVAAILLAAGADPAPLQFNARRALLNLPARPDMDLMSATAEEFDRGRRRRFGKHNPELLEEPFYQVMIRSGVSGYQATKHFNADHWSGPTWCAERFGQSITFLPDGRIVQIAGEHEDHYDPDFCIYNDVFVHDKGGAIRIFGYPEEVFAPTDFHTATLVGTSIFIIGSLGYPASRSAGQTPLYKLDTNTWKIEKLAAGGESPGRIYSHRAVLRDGCFIHVSGGTQVVAAGSEGEDHIPNSSSFILDTNMLAWSVISIGDA